MVETEVLLDADRLALNEPCVEVPTLLGDIDLHSFADFQGFTYRTVGDLWLEWTTGSAPAAVLVSFEWDRSVAGRAWRYGSGAGAST